VIALNVAALLSRLDAMLDERQIGGEAGSVLAFDADGTLWTGDVTRDLVAFMMSERPLRSDGRDRLAELVLCAGGDVRGDVYDQLAWLVLSYQAGRISDAVAVEAVVASFAGHEPEEFQDLVAEAVGRSGLERRFRHELTRVFEWGRRRDVPVVVVSASARVAVEEALQQVGLEASTVLGCEPRVVGGRLAAELARPVLAGHAKVEAFRAHTQAPVLAAFGDDVRDLPLLSLGRLRVGVWPTAELVARAGECGGLEILHCG